MSETVYLISRGEYSDYEVYAVFTDEAVAKAKVFELNKPFWDAKKFVREVKDRRSGYNEEEYPYYVEEKPLNRVDVAATCFRVGVYGDDGALYTAHVASPTSEYDRSRHAEGDCLGKNGQDRAHRYIKIFALGSTLTKAIRMAWEKRNRYMSAYPNARFVFPSREINKIGGIKDEIARIKTFFEEQPHG